MEEPEKEKWTVVILTEKREFDRIYYFAPDTTLIEIIVAWMKDVKQTGYWVFTSADERRYLDDFMTLESVGGNDMTSRIVNLRIKLLKVEPTTEIFAHVNDKCLYIEVEPNQFLYEVLQCLPGVSRDLERNGVPLNLEETIIEAGLRNKDVIQECQRQMNINVKLSNGVTMIIQLTEKCLVLHLFDEVKIYEKGDFSLSYQGRYLQKHERIRKLKQVVEVTKVIFDVNIGGQHISWKTRSEPITFTEFLSQLALHGKLDIEELNMMEFVCVGCRRCISESEDDQLLPIRCCREMSLTLIAKQYSKTKNLLALEAIIERIQQRYEHFIDYKSNNCGQVAQRFECSKLEEDFANEGIDYNLITQLCERFCRDAAEINGLDTNEKNLKLNNIKPEERFMKHKEKNAKSSLKSKTLVSANIQFEEGFETLTQEKINTVEKLQTLQDENIRYIAEIKSLTDVKAKSEEEIKSLTDVKAKSEEEIKSLTDDKATSDMQIKSLTEDKAKSDQEIKSLKDDKARLAEEIKLLKEDKAKSEEEIKSLTEDKAKSDKEIKLLKEDMTKSVEEIKSLRDEKAKSDKQIKSLTEDKAKSDKEIKSLKDDKARLAEEINLLKEDKAKSEEEIKSLTEDKAKSVEEIKSLREDMTKSVEEIKSLRDEKAKYDKEIKSLTDDKSKSDMQIKSLTDDKAKSDKQIKSLTEDKAKSDKEIKSLTDDKAKSDKEIKSLKDDKARLAEEINLLMEDKAKSEEEIKSLTEDKAKSDKEIKSLKEDMTKSVEEIMSLRDEKAKCDKEIKSLTDDKSKSDVESKSLMDDKAKFDEESKSLKEDMAKSEEQIKSLTKDAMNSAVEIASLKKENIRSLEEIKTLKVFVRGMLVEDNDVKLLVYYDSNIFSPNLTRQEIHLQGKYTWKALPHINCTICKLNAGWVSFREVRDALQPLFSKNIIQLITQRRGFVDGREVARVTSPTDEMSKYVNERIFCGVEGKPVTWEEAGKPQELRRIGLGDRVLICGGRWRTALTIKTSQ